MMQDMVNEAIDAEVGVLEVQVNRLEAENQRLRDALLAVEALLNGWPTMRALSAIGAKEATDRKVQARSIIATALAAEKGEG